MSPDLQTTRISLPTGVTLKVETGGAGEPILFLHGFPESHRTWRHQMAALMGDFHVIAPDQRGFGGSDKPIGVEEYAPEKAVDDVFALAGALDIGRFTLVGHDWGGVIAWLAAIRHPERVARLVIVNAPHPLIFQRSLIEDPAQRAASQYINVFRSRGAETGIRLMGLHNFFDKTIAPLADVGKLPEAERDAYLEDWGQPGAITAMLNWYRAANTIVPAVGEDASMPMWARLPFPKVTVPTLVIWGLDDTALLPVQFAGLADHVDDLRIVTAPGVGHFIVWEEPKVVTTAIRDFIVDTPVSTRNDPGRD